MGAELIDQYVDRGKFASDTEFMEAQLGKVIALFDKVNGIKVDLKGASSLKGVTAATEEGIKTNARLTESLKAVNAVINQRFASEAKLITQQTDYAKATAANRLEIQKTNKELKDQAALQQANTGSLERAQAQVKILRAEQGKLNLFTKEGQDRNAELIVQIDKYNVFIKKNSDALAQQKINVGNYSGAISVLKTSLDEVIKKMDAQNKAGKGNTDVMKALEKEYAILNQLVNSQAAGFANAKAEIKENQAALLKMQQAGLAGTDAFKKLAQATAELKDDVADLSARTKTLGSDSFVFDSLIQGAQTLAGVYGVAQGAAALFGEENEELQKTFVKLQAIMTVIQGLQSVVNGLQKESALVLGLQAAKEKVLLGIQTIRNFVLRGTVTATAANTVATNANTGAMVATTGATVAATVAARALRIALIATGIGAIVVLLISAAAAMGAFSDDTEEATESMDGFNSRLEFSKELLNSNIDSLRFMGQIQREQAKQRGASDNELTTLEIENLKKVQNAYMANAKERQAEFDKEVAKEKGYNAEKAKALLEEIEASKKAAGGTARDIILLQEQARTKEVEKGAAIRKKLQDDAAKRAQDYAKRELAAQVEITRLGLQTYRDYYKAIVDDEKKSFEERLAATTQFYRLSQQLIDFENNQVQKDPTKTIKEKELAENKAIIATRNLKVSSEKITQNLIDSNHEKRKAQGKIELEEFRERERQKQQIAKDILETQTNREEIALNEQFELDAKGVSARKRLKLETELQEAITKLREKAAIAALKLEESELLRKRALLQLFKLDTSAIDVLITQNQIAQSNLRISNTKREQTEKQKIWEAGLDTAVLIETQASEVLSAILAGQNIKRKNEIQDQIEDIDKRKEAEINAVTQSLLSEQDKAAKIAIINATSQAQKEQLELRQRRLDQQRAKFERDLGILQIIIQIGVAIAKQQYAAAALAGAALIKALATPLPRFYKGKTKGQAYEGPAYVNDHPDGKTMEVIERADGSVEFPQGRNVITDVKANDIIHPSVEAFKNAALGAAHRDANIGMNIKHQPKEDKVYSALAQQTKLLKQIAGKKELHLGATDRGMTALWQYGSSQTTYVNENTNW